MDNKISRQYGLIGFPLSHSFSRNYFSEKFEREGIQNATYENFPLENIHLFPGLCEKYTRLRGLNVTIPYKESVIAFLDELNEEARLIGAVNTILFAEGKRTGFNTDAWGFEHSLVPLLLPQDAAALVLGTGGASKAVTYVLDKLGINWKYVSRRGGENVIGYEELTANDILTHHLIINTTPLGMYPETNSLPALPYASLTAQHFLYDLVYNPEVTAFLQKGIDKGARVKNGLDMLQLQAERAWEIWNSY